MPSSSLTSHNSSCDQSCDGSRWGTIGQGDRLGNNRRDLVSRLLRHSLLTTNLNKSVAHACAPDGTDSKPT